MGIAERDYMRRDHEPPQIKWRHVWIFLAGAVLVITFGVDRCSSAAKKDRHLIKGFLVLNINDATVEELQTLPDVGPARDAHYSESTIRVRGRALRKTGLAKNRC
jgi:hypothetical protein